MADNITDLDARLAAAHEKLTASVAALTTSEAWGQMLRVAGRFHRYSPNNVLLITVQRPDATLVAGYRAWAQLGRQVQRGERGIAMLAPVIRKVETPDVTDGDEAVRRLRGFRIAHVFDVSQTEGKPLPDCGPTLLAGGSPHGLWDRLVDQVHTAGFSLDRGDCGAANGYTDHLSHHVRVRADVSPAQACKTLAHELAHVMLHGPDQQHRARQVAEVEAESVAYVVSSAAGLPTDDYSVPYVAGWASAELEVIQEAATRVLGTARQIIERAGPPRDPLDARANPLARAQDHVADRDNSQRLAS